MRKDLEPQSCIASVPIFKHLSQEEIDEIVMIASHKKLDKGAFIYQAGESLDSLYVVHEGKVKITRISEDGKEQVIRILSSGEFLGELALFNDAKVKTYAEVIEPSIICLVENKKLKALMSKSPTLTFKMMDELSKRLDKAEALIEHNSLYSADAKVARLLLELAKDHFVYFHTTKVNLSSQLGMTPETFSRKLKSFHIEGVIEIMTHKTIKILDSYQLELKINPDQL